MTVLDEPIDSQEARVRVGLASHQLLSFFHYLGAPLAAALTFGGLAADHGGAFLQGALVTFVAFYCAALVVGRERRWASLLTFVAAVSKLTAPLVGTVVLAVIAVSAHLHGAGVLEVAAAFAVAAACEGLAHVLFGRGGASQSTKRIAVIGSAYAATSLSRELAIARVTQYEVVGRIATADGPEELDDGDVPVIGELTDIGPAVAEHEIELLVMTGEAPRLTVFNEIAASCLHLPVRLWQLSSFYEEVFGHVPVAEINASWFQYIMHPRFRTPHRVSKRALDLAVAIPVGILLAPVMLVVALVIRRDGGPALFKQTRIGEGGRPFTVYKLRTMRVGVETAAQWAEFDDPRVTSIGRFLRCTHLDEIPQLVNVLRGEMSVVGPRPEQPEFVERLEQWVPFYTRRHLLKPGITGWAQVRCGYAGSDVGSAWKLCHDLYYLKHRSTALDLVILAETMRTLVADRQYSVEPKNVSFILDADWFDAEAAPATSS